MQYLEEIQKYVELLYRQSETKDFKLHNLQRTREIVHYAGLLGQRNGLSEEDMLNLEICAWFSETGFLRDYRRNEEKSMELMSEYLAETDMDPQRIEVLKQAIAATRIPHSPKNLMEESLCDAITYELGSEGFEEKLDLYREEVNRLWNTEMEALDFYDVILGILNSHKYFTSAAKELFDENLNNNRKIIRKRIKKKARKLEEKLDDQNEKVKKLNKKYEEMKAPARGIETMFKVTSRNQITLSQIADNKANILITVCSIILSVMVTMVIRKINEYPHMALPSLGLILTSLVTIIFAILATRPKVSQGTFTKEDIREKRTNLLFFGNFYKMSFKDYEWGVREMMRDYDGLYHNMILDQYTLGVVLARKYRLLRKAFNIFMFGLSGSILMVILIEIFRDYTV